MITLVTTDDIPVIVIVLMLTAIYCVYNMYQLKNVEIPVVYPYMKAKEK